jgi:hypothetical protein
LLSSTIQTKRREAAATIFSRVSAPPPPLIMWPAVDFVRAVDIKVEIAGGVEVADLDAVTAEQAGGRL